MELGLPPVRDRGISKVSDELSEEPILYLVFTNMYDPKSQEELEEEMLVENCRKTLLQVLRANENQEEDDSSIEGLTNIIPWLSDSYYETEKIPRKEFLNTSIASVLQILRGTFGFKCNLYASRDQDEIFCQVIVKEKWLRREAERTGYRLQFKRDTNDDPKVHEFKQVNPWAQFETERMGAVPHSEHLFRQFDFQEREIDGNGSLFKYADKARLVIQALLERFNFNEMEKAGILQQYFVIHKDEALNELKTEWATIKAIFRPQPLRKIRDYFGEKIGLYFAWMNSYLKAMICAAVIGLGVFIATMVLDKGEKGFTIENILPLLFAIFLSLWGSVFDQIWVRQEKTLAWRWGTTDFYEEEEQRADFTGEYRLDEVSGRYKKVRMSQILYKLRKFTSYSVATIFMLIVIGAVAGIFIWRTELDREKNLYGIYVCAVINAIQIRIMNIIYGKIANWMTDWENHETESVYNDNLAIKLFLFKFVNSYVSLFYIAFFKEASTCKFENCLTELSIQLGTIFIVNLLLNLVELGMPYAKHKWKVYRENKKVRQMQADDPSIRLEMGPIEAQSKLEPYDSPLDDYMEMTIQYGYVVLFCAAFPLTPVLALIELVLEIRVDAWKLCNLTRRPRPDRAEDIGVWKSILMAISYIGAFTNAALIIFASPAFSQYSKLNKLLLFFAVEHILIFCKFLIDIIVPDFPEVVTDGYAWSKRIINDKLYKKMMDIGRAAASLLMLNVQEKRKEKEGKTAFTVRPEDINYYDSQ